MFRFLMYIFYEDFLIVIILKQKLIIKIMEYNSII